MRTYPLLASAAAAGLIAVRAEAAEPTDAELAAGFTAFKAEQKQLVGALETEVDKLIGQVTALALNGTGGTGSMPAEDREYTGQFTAYFRRGQNEQTVIEANATGRRSEIQAAMSVGDNASGGYLAPTEWDRRVRQAQIVKSPIRRISQVVVTQVGAYSTLWATGQPGSGWVGETASRPGTSTPALAPVTFAAGELYANPAITQRLLDDAEFDVEGWLATSVSDEFDRQESIAFASGDGVNKPFGFLQYVTGGAADGRHPGGNLVVVPSGAAATIPGPDALVDFVYGLPAAYQANATWLMNSTTAALIRKMKDADGRFIWAEGLTAGQPATLLGRPVEIEEGMPPVAAGNLAIAFGDFRAGYVINDRFGVRVLRDPFTNKPYVHFYTTKRVGAGVLDPRAIRLMRIAAA